MFKETEFLVENSFYDSTTKDEFLKDKEKIANAFWISTIGILGLYAINSKLGATRTYFVDDGKLRISSITDDNKDVSLAVKLYHKIGGIKKPEADELLKLFVLIKQRKVTADSLDNEKVVGIIEKINFQVARPHMMIVSQINRLLNGEIDIKGYARDVYGIVKSRKKELLVSSGEFYRIGRDLQKLFAKIQDPVASIQPSITSTPVQVASTKDVNKSSKTSFDFSNLSLEPIEEPKEKETIVQDTGTSKVRDFLIAHFDDIPSSRIMDVMKSEGIDFNKEWKEIADYILPMENNPVAKMDLRALLRKGFEESLLFEELTKKDSEFARRYNLAVCLFVESLGKLYQQSKLDLNVKSNILGYTPKEIKDIVSENIPQMIDSWCSEFHQDEDVLGDFRLIMSSVSKHFRISNLGKHDEFQPPTYLILFYSEWIDMDVLASRMKKFGCEYKNGILTGVADLFEDAPLLIERWNSFGKRKLKTVSNGGEDAIIQELLATFKEDEERAFAVKVVAHHESLTEVTGKRLAQAIIDKGLVKLSMDLIYLNQQLIEALEKFPKLFPFVKSCMETIFPHLNKKTVSKNQVGSLHYKIALKFFAIPSGLIGIYRSLFLDFIAHRNNILADRIFYLYEIIRMLGLDGAQILKDAIARRDKKLVALFDQQDLRQHFSQVEDKDLGTVLEYVGKKKDSEKIDFLLNIDKPLGAISQESLKDVLKQNMETWEKWKTHKVLSALDDRDSFVKKYRDGIFDVSGENLNHPNLRHFILVASDSELLDFSKSLRFDQQIEILERSSWLACQVLDDHTMASAVERLAFQGLLNSSFKENISANINDEKSIWGANTLEALIMESTSEDEVSSEVFILKYLNIASEEQMDNLLTKLTDRGDRSTHQKMCEAFSQSVQLRTAYLQMVSDDVPIKPLAEMTLERLSSVLENNNINLIEYSYDSNDTLETIKRKVKAETLLPTLHVAEEEGVDYNLRSAELDRFNAGRHGHIGLKVLKSFNVSIPKQEGAFKEWGDNWIGEKGEPPRGIVPSFHGTGSVAASMILRNGFKIISSRDSSVVGRMLGDGVYFANYLDKAAQYVGDEGYGRKIGTKGYIFEMDSYLGEPEIDYNCAGVPNDPANIDNTVVSPEWCVYTPNSQLRIKKAHLVELVDRGEILVLRETYGVYENVMKMASFKSFLHESEDSNSNAMTFIFQDGKIPTKDGLKDFSEVKNLPKNVKMDRTAYGPAIVIYGTDRTETNVIRFGEIFQHKENDPLFQEYASHMMK